MSEVLPVSLSIVVPNGLIIVKRRAIYRDSASSYTYPVQSFIIVTIVTRNVIAGSCQSMRVANDTVAPMNTYGTHNIIGGKVLIIGVNNHHDSLFVGWISNVGCAMKIPNYVASHLPCFLFTRWLPCSERLSHKCKSVIIDEISSHSFGLCIFSHDKIALDEQLHAGLLVDLSHKLHLAL